MLGFLLLQRPKKGWNPDLSVFFPVIGDFGSETGSLDTGLPATPLGLIAPMLEASGSACAHISSHD